MRKTAALLLVSFFFAGCASNAYTNVKLNDMGGAFETKATFSIKEDRGGHESTLGILALSGGGSRAAYWSGSIMLALEEVYGEEGLNILEEIDVISAVSGGSLAGAYYAISYSPGDSARAESGRVWDERTVRDLMSRNYRARWIWRWFLPTNIVRYWFTAYDRSDIMAKVLADNLFDKKITGANLKFRDMNPDRPNIILNSTNGTAGGFSERFTFTLEDFRDSINSDINEYEISRAVMASASFPGIFHYMTLKDFRLEEDGKAAYLHVFDGGVTDNLGLDSIKRVLALNKDRFERVFIILVDAHVDIRGVSPEEHDTRRLFDYAVDLNLLDSVGSLLSNKRKMILDEFIEELKTYGGHSVLFYHIEFDDVGEGDLGVRLDNIKTDFSIKPDDMEAIERAAELLIVKENDCIKKIRQILTAKEPPATGGAYCKWPRR